MSDQASTHITALAGSTQEGKTQPTDQDAAGLAAGEMFVNTNNMNMQITTTTSSWRQTRFTTTSTTTS